VSLALDRPPGRSILLLAGLAAAMALRLGAAGIDGPRPVPAGLVFAAALMLLVAAAGWKPGAVRVSAVLLGVLGACGLVLFPAWLVDSPSIVPLDGFPAWAVVVSVVAIAEEILLRGALFDLVQPLWGAWGAATVAAIAFALLHVPLYGWGAVPLDLAVGLWLGGLRVLSNGVAAPAIAHTLADLSAWWLV
jgi:membrane protease YdiL (CAAX protease family)